MPGSFPSSLLEKKDVLDIEYSVIGMVFKHIRDISIVNAYPDQLVVPDVPSTLFIIYLWRFNPVTL